MSKLKFNLTNIYFWIGALVSAFLFEDIDFLNKVGGRYLPLSETSFYLIFSIALLSYIAMFVYDIVFNRHRVNIAVIIILLVFTGSAIAGIWLFEGMSFTSGAPDYILSFNDKLRQSLITFLFGLTLIAVFTVYITNHPSIRRMSYVYIIVLIVCYGLSIYSLVTESTKYAIVASGSGVKQSIGSLFYNSNMFAVILLLGTASAIGLNYFKKNIISYVSMLFFFVIQVFVSSLTCTLITASLILVYFIIEIIIRFKKQFVVGMIELTILLVSVVSIILTVIIASKSGTGEFAHFCKYLTNELFNSNYSTFSNRLYLWEYSNQLIIANPFATIFGYGFLNSEYLLGGMKYNPALIPPDALTISAHSGYYQLMLNFGAVGAAVFLAFFVWYIICIVKLFKNHKRFCLIYLALAIAYLSLAVTESIFLFDADAQGLIIGAFIFMPVIIKRYHEKHLEVGDAAVYKDVPHMPIPELVVKQTARIILGFAVPVMALLVFDPIIYNDSRRLLIGNITFVLGLALFTYPYLAGLWAKNSNLNKFTVKFILNTLLIGLLMAGCGVLTYFYSETYTAIIWLSPAVLFITLIIYLIVYSLKCKGSFKLYSNIFVAFKSSLGGILAAIGVMVVAYLLQPTYFIFDVYLCVAVPVIATISYFAFTILIPFKDTREILKYESSYSIDLLKHDVIVERLENEHEI